MASWASSSSSPSSAALSSELSSTTPNFVISNTANLDTQSIWTTPIFSSRSLYFAPSCAAIVLSTSLMAPNLPPLGNSLAPMENILPTQHSLIGLKGIKPFFLGLTPLSSTLHYAILLQGDCQSWVGIVRTHRYGSLSRSHIVELKKHLQHVKKGSSSI